MTIIAVRTETAKSDKPVEIALVDREGVNETFGVSKDY
jgi:hypothetical protein